MDIQGKNVGEHFYWHHILTSMQPQSVQDGILKAEQLAEVIAGEHYNIVKYPKKGNILSFLWYPGFFEDPFPVLSWGWIIDCTSQQVKRRSYAESLNPPILHRKELFLPINHPRRNEYVELTKSAEQLGLFENSRSIGFRLGWDALICERGYYLEGHKFLPIGNSENNDPELEIDSSNSDLLVKRHRTALSRYNFSAPMQALARFNFLDGQKTVFDYGCGKGDDLRNLLENNISADGWDPHFHPDGILTSAHIVNLGFVINVIEHFDERLTALRGAYSLTEELLVVSAMLYNQNAFKGRQYKDGIITSRNTFQKYFTQQELKEFIDETLDVESIPVGPGIFFVFRDGEAEQRFLLGRQRSRSNLLRLTKRETAAPRTLLRDIKYQERLLAITQLRNIWLSLGREPSKNEVYNLDALQATFGTLSKAVRFLQNETNPELLERAKKNRIADMLVYFALYSFSQRKAYRNIDPVLQMDIKYFFGSFAEAIKQGRALLFRLSDTKAIESECIYSAEQGIGLYDEEGALHLPSDQVERLPPLLRIYIGCAAKLYGDISTADVIKIHVRSGKVSLMKYDDFYGLPVPLLLERVKIKFRSLDFDLFSYGELHEPTYLYLKSQYLNEDSPGYIEQLEFDEKLEALGLFDFSKHGPRPQKFRDDLNDARWEIDGMRLIRSRQLPDLQSLCGQHFTYSQLIECGETWDRLKLNNVPLQANTYTALYDLATNILDPVIDYFGIIRLTYGFSSAALAKNISSRIAPKLDQHVSCELSRGKIPICPRLGAAVDFIVEDEDMQEVAEWIVENTPFDRLYFYGSDRPIHVSYGPENKKDFIEMRLSQSGRRVPFRMSLNKRE